jgi:phage shock protein E
MNLIETFTGKGKRTMKKIFTLKGLAIGGAVIVALVAILVVVYLKVIAPSFVGQTGPDGDMLRKYIEPASLRELVKKPDPAIWIIDVRPEDAYREGHIPTARSFSSQAIESRLNELPKDKSLIIYCETGGRVQLVIRKLKRHGYTRYMNWGGNARWIYEREQGSGQGAS